MKKEKFFKKEKGGRVAKRQENGTKSAEFGMAYQRESVVKNCKGQSAMSLLVGWLLSLIPSFNQFSVAGWSQL